VEPHSIHGLLVHVKRDDLTSEVYGGNKVRSLEFVLARPARRVLTYSSLSAHHAYATAVHARRLGLATDAILVREGVRGPACAALPRVAARVVECRGVLGAFLATARLWRPGTRVIPPGAMSARGALGYLAAVFELDEMPARIYTPVGSGTTVSGLLAGLMLRDADTEVVGVRVADAIASCPPLLWRRAFRAVRLLRRADRSVPRVRCGNVRLRIEVAEGPYGEATPGSLAAIGAAAAGGLVLEPTYTGKALAVLLAEGKEGSLFLNTYAGHEVAVRSP